MWKSLKNKEFKYFYLLNFAILAMRTQKLFSALFVCILVAAACSVQRKATEVKVQNQSYLYNPGSTYMHPEFSVYHNNDTASQVYIKFYTDEFLFNQANPEQTLQANLRINYQLFDITVNKDNPELVDSASFLRSVEKRSVKKVLIVPFFLHTLPGKEYSLKIVSFDLNRKASHTAYLYVDKLTKSSVQNFKLISYPGGAPLFRQFIYKGEVFKIICNRLKFDSLYIQFTKSTLPLPPPAFSSSVEKPLTIETDSIWRVPYSPTLNFSFENEGLYFIRTNRDSVGGLLLMNLGKNYPKIKTAESMIPSLEYITTSVEFKKISADPNVKLALDNFWLKLGQNPEVGRELIRVYYNRMYFANYYFTSYKEGWKTDRGMIYMIFGQPNYITKTAGTEKWEYYHTKTARSIEFIFHKVPSIYTNNHFVLERNEYYTGFWREAVDSWRSGKAYSSEE